MPVTTVFSWKSYSFKLCICRPVDSFKVIFVRGVRSGARFFPARGRVAAEQRPLAGCLPQGSAPLSGRRARLRVCLCSVSPVLYLLVPHSFDRCKPFLGTSNISLLILFFLRVVLAFLVPFHLHANEGELVTVWHCEIRTGIALTAA